MSRKQTHTKGYLISWEILVNVTLFFATVLLVFYNKSRLLLLVSVRAHLQNAPLDTTARRLTGNPTDHP